MVLVVKLRANVSGGFVGLALLNVVCLPKCSCLQND
jgi:hypothetical protein